MRLFRKSLPFVLSLALAGGAMAKKNDKDKAKSGQATPTPAAGATPADKSKAGDAKKGSKDAKGSKDSNKKPPKPKKGAPAATPDPSQAGTPGNDKKLQLPLVEGNDSIGLKIPHYDDNGNLQMVLHVGVATKIDPDHVKMRQMQVEMYNEEGEPDMNVELPVSMLDLNTRIVTSDTHTTIRRSDFTLTGDSVRFNTVTKAGMLVGHVHMTIYDLNGNNADDGATKDSKTTTPSTEAPNEQKAPAGKTAEARSAEEAKPK